MSVVKELSCKWIISGYDHIRSSPEIIRNGFKKAGIISAIEHVYVTVIHGNQSVFRDLSLRAVSWSLFVRQTSDLFDKESF